MKKSIKIQKAKLTKDLTLEVEYVEIIETEKETVMNEVKLKGGYPVHKDLYDAFKLFIPHCIAICELIPEAILDDIIQGPGADRLISLLESETFKKYEVTGISIGGEDEHEGITIVGKKYLANKKVLNLITPFKKWEDENAPYKYEEQLEMAYNAVIDQVRMYLDGKHAPSVQMKIDLEAA